MVTILSLSMCIDSTAAKSPRESMEHCLVDICLSLQFYSHCTKNVKKHRWSQHLKVELWGWCVGLPGLRVMLEAKNLVCSAPHGLKYYMLLIACCPSFDRLCHSIAWSCTLVIMIFNSIHLAEVIAFTSVSLNLASPAE